jgi:hypothetical protein
MMRINKKQFIILTFLIFWGIIAVSITTGVWKTKMQGIEIHSEEITGDEIKGWMKFKAIEKLFNVPLNYVRTELKLPKDIDIDKNLKELKENYNFEMDELKEIVVKYHKKE